MDSIDPTEPSLDAATASERPTWQRILRSVVVLVVVALAIMAFASWYFTNTFDFMFGPPTD